MCTIKFGIAAQERFTFCKSYVVLCTFISGAIHQFTFWALDWTVWKTTVTMHHDQCKVEWSISSAAALAVLYLAYDRILHPPRALRHIPAVSYFNFLKAAVKRTPLRIYSNENVMPILKEYEAGIYLVTTNNHDIIRCQYLRWLVDALTPRPIRMDGFCCKPKVCQNGAVQARYEEESFLYLGLSHVIFYYDQMCFQRAITTNEEKKRLSINSRKAMVAAIWSLKPTFKFGRDSAK